jgi:phage terminase large subunit-like protein
LATQRQHWNDHFNSDFSSFAHDHQITPERANSGADWATWLILGGRGAGKTRAGAQWVRNVAINDRNARIALIGETEHDAREVLSLLRAGAVDGLSIGFRTVKGNIDPRTRVRRLVAVELWEISIVTFPLLAGARVRAVKAAASPSQVCGPRCHTRARAPNGIGRR